MLERFLLAVDLSESFEDLVGRARALADARGATLALVHVAPDPVDLQPLLSDRLQSGLPQWSEVETSVRTAVAERLAAAGLADLPLFVERGEPYAEIVRRAEAWGATLLVVGSHGKTGLTRMLLGSVAERVVRYAHCPVLVLRSGETSKVVVVATDLSDPSLPAIARGADEARVRGARLVVVHAVDSLLLGYLQVAGAPFGGTSALPSVAVQEETRGALTNLLQSSMARFGAEGEVKVLDGAARATVVNALEELRAELLVIGTHGRTGLARLALGSVAEALVRLAPCSVLVVRQVS
jgi:nucleotide-binding universal stress UspA family protein